MYFNYRNVLRKCNVYKRIVYELDTSLRDESTDVVTLEDLFL